MLQFEIHAMVMRHKAAGCSRFAVSQPVPSMPTDTSQIEEFPIAAAYDTYLDLWQWRVDMTLLRERVGHCVSGDIEATERIRPSVLKVNV